MIDIQPLHTPRWQQDGDNWLMIAGTHAVAALIWNPGDRNFPHLTWLSAILAESPFDDHGCSAVDFGSLECGQYDLEQWWHHAMRGGRYNPRLHRNCPHCGCQAQS